MAVKTERLDVRVTRQNKRLIERAALVTGQPVTSFVLSSALERAREALESESRTLLSERDGRAFLRMLEEDRTPSEALVRAVKRSRRHG
jgi:uncharacterized protein (DUF1778 family)